MLNESLWDGIDGLILDAVGTLIDPEPSVADVYLGAAARQGVVLDRSEVRARFHGQFRNDEVDEARGPLVTDESIEWRRWRRIVGSVLPEVPDLDRAFAELWEHFGRSDAWRCFADVGPAAEALRGAGVPVRIASNFDARLRTVVNGLPEVASWAPGLLISSEVGVRKPHPAFYEAAAASLGLPPGRVLFVGDDPENDVLGPRRAGMRGLLLDRGGKAVARHEVVRSLAEVATSREPGPGRP